MKLRVLITLLVIIGLVCSLVWWLQQPAVAEKEAAASLVSSSKAAESKISGGSPASNATKPEIVFESPVNRSGKNQPVTITQKGVNPTAQSLTTKSSKGIQFATAPAGAKEYLLGRIPIINKAEGNGRRGMPTDDNFDLEPPLVYNFLDLSVLANGGSMTDSISKLQAPGAYYIVDVGGVPVQGMAVLSNGAGGFMVPAVGTGSSKAAEISGAMKYLAGLDAVQKGYYEAHLFNFNAFVSASEPRVLAIWLKSNSDGPDLIYTLSTSTTGLNPRASSVSPNTLFTVDEFRTVAGTIALQQIADRNAAAAARGTPTQ